MIRRRIALMLLAAALTVAAPVFGEPVYPPGVPNLTDPQVQRELVLVTVSLLDGDPDFPVLLLARASEGPGQFLLVLVDARNGKDTWSLAEDRAVLFMLLSESATVLETYLDEGFAADGTPSGRFRAAGPDQVAELMAKLRAARRRSSRILI